MRPHRRRPGARSIPRRGPGLLAALLACWLLTQLLGQAHAVLHPRQGAAAGAVLPEASPEDAHRPAAAAPTGTAARRAATPAGAAAHGALARWLARAFHPRGDAGSADDGVCRLYGQLAHGDCAADTRPDAAAGTRAPVAPAGGDAAVAAAPRRGPQARAPPAAA